MMSIAGHERIIVAKSNYLSTIALSAEGVNIVFSQVSLIFIATFFFKYFCDIATYSFLRTFLGCAELQFLIPFLYLLYSGYYVLHVPPCFCHTSRVFLKYDARAGNLVQELVLAFFPCSAFFPKVSRANVRWAIAYHTFSSRLNP